MTVITVFGRHGCHLCDVAVDVLYGMREELNYEIEKIIKISLLKSLSKWPGPNSTGT